MISGADSAIEAVKTNCKIFIAQHKTLTSMLKNDNQSVNNLMINLGIGIRIFDEVHTNFVSTCNILSLSNVENNIYLTATPRRSQWQETKLYNDVFKYIPVYYGKIKEDDKHAQVIMCGFNSKPSANSVTWCTTKRGFQEIRWATSIDKYKFDLMFNTLIKIINKFKLIESNKKISIVFPTLKLINRVKDKLSEMYEDLDIGILTSETKPQERIQVVNKNIFITTAKMFNKGIDISDLEVIINYSQFASSVISEQLIGRLRNVPGFSHTLIDVTDFGYQACIDHQRQRKNAYKKKAKQVIIVTETL